MEKDLNLKKLENKAFEIAFLDGLTDMLFGIVWLGYGIAYFLYDYLPSPLNSFLGLIITLIGAIMYIICKFYVSSPRLGVVKLSNSQKTRSKRLLLFNLIAVVMTVIIVIFTVIIPNTIFLIILGSLGFWTAIIFGLIPFIIMSWLAFIFNYNRFYIYGAIMGFALFLIEYLRFLNIPGGGIALLISGGGILAAGIFIFIDFIKKNPIPKGENHAQGQD
ncbi:MAG: hypothetical protein EAX96_07450 [Candidatus Lokiarchaeota archaeon]|nr:hypothetical protein [Candidatus Lokiarchaeota archaeon]